MTQSPSQISINQANPPFFWGVDVGGTNLKFGLVDDLGRTIEFKKLPTEEALGPQAAVDRVTAAIRELETDLGLGGDSIPAVGLGTPGTMDLPNGMLVDPPNLPNWWNFPIRDAVARALDRPVSFLNDANAAAYGEFWLGTGQQHDSLALLTLGTGVGGGLIIHGELVNGVNSFGSECGHMIVDGSPTARLCAWGGGRGQLEAYASASAVVARTRERLTAGEKSSLAGLLGGSNAELTAKEVYLAAEKDDQLALDVIDETAYWLGVGITTLIHIVDPGLVVLGGAMDFGGASSSVGLRFLECIRNQFEARTFDHVWAGTKIEYASLGGDAGYLGSAGYARKQYQHNVAVP